MKVRFALFALLVFGPACARQDAEVHCWDGKSTAQAGSTGTAEIFAPDPSVQAGRSDLAPASFHLDDYRKSVNLDHLNGNGLLEGQYVRVVNGTACEGRPGAFDPRNQFMYSHGDSRFQESMTYYFSDSYRAYLDSLGYLLKPDPVNMIAHCMVADNAFFARTEPTAGEIVSNVCLGDSFATPGASYADDAEVTLHELQHASTSDAYDPDDSLARFWYDEAGTLNEAISDFAALMQVEPLLTTIFDPRIFSRWALGTFIPGQSNIRGAQKCPVYDSQYAQGCAGFPSFSGSSSTISYVYPDGLGWPYASDFTDAASAFKDYPAQEEIHSAGVVMEGALWDAYRALQDLHGGDAGTAHDRMIRYVLEAVRHLPHPNDAVNQLSPVTLRDFAQTMVDQAATEDQNAITAALTSRGLIGGNILAVGWASVPADGSATVKIEDDPKTLVKWIGNFYGDTSVVTQKAGASTNGRLDPGELVAIWFNLANAAADTAGGVRITATISDADADQISFPGATVNVGYVSPMQAQIEYGKVNGSRIVSQLAGVPTGTTYFLTNPFFSRNYTTAVFVKVSGAATHGRVVNFHVDAEPSNGAAAALDFPVAIN